MREPGMSVPADIRLVVRDLFGTTEADVLVGQTVVTTFNCGTRHVDSAMREAQEVLADALRPLVEAAARARGRRVGLTYEAEL